MHDFQRTLAAPVSVNGIGYWTDREITVTFQPSEPETGLVFVRDDLPGKPRIPVSPEFRVAIPRRTSLEKGGARVEMVEHILSALTGMGVENCEIHVTACEMPGMDGSALAFVEAFDSVGYETQNAPAKILTLSQPLTVRDSATDRWVTAQPATELRLKFELLYKSASPIENQTAEFTLTPEIYRQEIAPCRTFVTQAEANAFQSAGLAKRATYQDLLVFGPNGPIENSVRFPNECARHKILDLIGDLALLGSRLRANVHAFRSGHDLNAQIVQTLLKDQSI
ncbi:MAG: UDP-3-O-acyl-N-acetylglucosamine deacetylase [Thermoguttaceae bacterium]|nr:UDP-3-O-acyl-N-acetylglucosamine deacetylase [Thermoguttaceae bacterium]